MSESSVLSPSAAEQRVLTESDRHYSARADLAALLTSAGDAQRSCVSTATGAHVDAGESAASYLAAYMAGIRADHATASLAALDTIIDRSQDGRPRNARRQEIRQQVCAAHLVTLIPSVAALPWGHVRALIGAKIAVYDAERGCADCRQEWLQPVRAIVADAISSPVSVDGLRELLSGVTGKPTAAARKAAADLAAEQRAALIETLRASLADDSLAPERRAAILAQYPELSAPTVPAIDLAAMVLALAQPEQVDILARVLASLQTSWPEGVEQAFERASAIADAANADATTSN